MYTYCEAHSTALNYGFNLVNFHCLTNQSLHVHFRFIQFLEVISRSKKYGFSSIGKDQAQAFYIFFHPTRISDSELHFIVICEAYLRHWEWTAWLLLPIHDFFPGLHLSSALEHSERIKTSPMYRNELLKWLFFSTQLPLTQWRKWGLHVTSDIQFSRIHFTAPHSPASHSWWYMYVNIYLNFIN